MATSCLDKILCENASECTITILDVNGNPIDPLLIHTGDDVIFVLENKPGTTFDGWYDENNRRVEWEQSELGENYYLIPHVDCEKQYIAHFCYIYYRIRVTPNPSNCFQEYDIRYVRYGEVITLSALESTLCHFMNWTQNGEIISEERVFEYVVTGNANIVANYDVLLYNIEAIPQLPEQGVCDGGGNYAYNTNVVLVATPNSGYTFFSWDDNSTENPRTVVVTGNKRYVAQFIRHQYFVLMLSSIGGTASGAGIYYENDVITLIAYPNTGWEFSYWRISYGTQPEVIEYGLSYNFVIHSNVTVIPVFAIAEYTVNIDITPVGCGYITPSLAPSYSYGDIITVEAVPNSGYQFRYWSDGLQQATRQITVTSNIELTAMFSVLPPVYTIQFILPDDTYTCGVYVNGVDIGEKEQNVVSVSVTEGTQLTIVPFIPQGKSLYSIVDENDVPIWEEGDSLSGITYVVGSSGETFTVNYTDCHYSLTVNFIPSNEYVHDYAEVEITVNGTTTTFTPTDANPSYILDNIQYGTEITMVAAQHAREDYIFYYWQTAYGTLYYRTLTINLTQDVVCTGIYHVSPTPQ